MEQAIILPNAALSVPSLIQPESNLHTAKIRQTSPRATKISKAYSGLPFQSIFSLPLPLNLSLALCRVRSVSTVHRFYGSCSICALYTVYCKRYKKFSEILIIFFEDLFRLTHYTSYRILLFGSVVSFFSSSSPLCLLQLSFRCRKIFDNKILCNVSYMS